MDSYKYYLYQGINPITKKCNEEKGFYSCGFFEDIQVDFCVKNADNCPLKLSNKLTLDTIWERKFKNFIKYKIWW